LAHQLAVGLLFVRCEGVDGLLEDADGVFGILALAVGGEPEQCGDRLVLEFDGPICLLV
jgi:hypothetical protein